MLFGLQALMEKVENLRAKEREPFPERLYRKTELVQKAGRSKPSMFKLFVADLTFDDNGSVTGIDREYQLTVNSHVNWAPFWHPDARHLVYTTSEMGHRNYEVFLIDADSGTLEGSPGPVRYGTRKRRITIRRVSSFTD